MTPLDARDRLLELADRYEQVGSLDLAEARAIQVHTKPGSRVPPGMSEILDLDEIERALGLVDEYAEGWCHMLLDGSAIDVVPDFTPARLRLLSMHAAWFVDNDDRLFAMTFVADLGELLRQTKNLACRGERRVHTWHRCTDPECKGWMTAVLGEHNGDLTCSKAGCGVTVPYDTWSRWPHARREWITVEHAKNLCGAATIGATYKRAARLGWRKRGEGKEVRFKREDVMRGIEDDVPVSV